MILPRLEEELCLSFTPHLSVTELSTLPCGYIFLFLSSLLDCELLRARTGLLILFIIHIY